MSAVQGKAGARPGADYKPDDAWSYACGQCGACCRGKDFLVTPYDVARIAEALGTLPAEVLARYVDPSRPMLRTTGEDGQCVFFAPGTGCTIHTGRPAVCRLYPLGRTIHADQTESFTEAEPMDQTKGQYGQAGTVADYLKTQGLDPYLEAMRRLGLFMDDAFACASRAGLITDVDSAVMAYWLGEGGPVPFNILGVDLLAGVGVFDDALDKLDNHIHELRTLCGLDLLPEQQMRLLETAQGRAIGGRLVITAAVLGVSLGVTPGFSGQETSANSAAGGGG